MTLTAAPEAHAPPVPALAERVGWLGLLGAFRRNTLEAFPRACLDAPVVTIPLPGGRMVLLSTPAGARHVLLSAADDFERLPAGRRVLGPIAGRGLVLADGEAWRHQRRVLAPAFTPRTLPLMLRFVARSAEDSCRRLEAGLGASVDLRGEMQRVALDIATTSMFSLETGPLGAEIRDLISGYLGRLGRPTVADFLLPPAWPTPSSPRRALFRRRWLATVRAVLAARRAQGQGQAQEQGTRHDAPRDLFDLLDAAHGDAPGGLLADEIGTLIVAGHETTASTLFWACTLLARAPAVQDALAAEARGLDLTEAGAAEALPHLRLARAVAQEALRLYPPVYVIARRAAQASTVEGVTIPAGSIVMIPTWILHRNPRWWDRPAAFDPGRFLDRPEPDRFLYLPFGAGPRICIGAQLALAEATLVLARLMRDFCLALDGDRPVLPVATTTVRPDHVPRFHLARRAG
ncbi:cytochrome P450 [Methylobacterium indicum]|uniref:Cytochrome P450 n=1 Tax=Methylobacterium indicum TaxID=1775910 RepID=A0ABR5HCT5_9HYPH|nr:cytochrome P450 [Methylobacterium indicum]KMO22688.1 cytochrome P450 [Methylobacterium indicum]KMO23720.1 cytochrome P450 [Methylobacterium indicum]